MTIGDENTKSRCFCCAIYTLVHHRGQHAQSSTCKRVVGLQTDVLDSAAATTADEGNLSVESREARVQLPSTS